MRKMLSRLGRFGLAFMLSSSLCTVAAVAQSDAEVTVYITKTGEKYHRGSCSSLRKSKIKVTLKEAKERGYGPCKNCSPPT